MDSRSRPLLTSDQALLRSAATLPPKSASSSTMPDRVKSTARPHNRIFDPAALTPGTCKINSAIMVQLLIVYHSRTGGSRQMAEAAFAAARAEVGSTLKLAVDAEPGDLLAADGYIFCAPENLAAISGIMKDFFDRCYYPVLGRIEGRPYAQMVCAGSDGENAARQTARIAKGWRLREVQEPLIICTEAQTPEEILAPKTISDDKLKSCRELGAAMGVGLSLGVF